jgi:hypothetical protein
VDDGAAQPGRLDTFLIKANDLSPTALELKRVIDEDRAGALSDAGGSQLFESL